MRRRGWGWQGRDDDTRNDQDRKGVGKEGGGERSRIHLDDDISTLTTYLGTYPVSFILVLV